MRRHRNFIGPAGMGGMVGLWGANSLIKSIQRGSTATGGAASATSTITAVSTADSQIFCLGSTSDFVGANASAAAGRVELTNATTVTVYNSGGSTVYVNWCVVEYLPGVIKSVQRGTVADAATGSASVTITEVNTTRTDLQLLGFTTNVADTRTNPRMSLPSATQVTITVGGAGVGTNNCGYQVTEFY